MHSNSAEQTLKNIVQASQQVITVATDYAKLVNNSQGSRIRLQEQLESVVAASNVALAAIDRTSLLSNDLDIDYLVEWLSSDESDLCLDTLKDMEGLLKDTLSRRFMRMVCKKDEIQQAMTLFSTRRPHFHPLLRTDAWKRREEIGQGLKVAQHHILGSDGGINVITKGVQGIEVMERGEREVLTGATNIGKKTGVTRTERKKQIDPKEVTEFLRWLDGLDCTGKHEDTLELRQAETCTWLPETERYRSWRRGDISFLWLEGKPGSGKSVLASSVIDELEHSQRGGEVLVFFYCDFRNERSTNPPEIMRSLISQLLRLANIDEIDCRDAVSELVERKSRGAAPPNDMKLLTRLVRSAAKLHDQPLIVIDALDECKDVEKLLNAVKGLNNGHIRLFVTSRPEQMIKETLSDLPSISLSEMTSAVLADMELHVTEELDSRRWLRVLELDLKEEIRSALLEAADGMFRWVQCQIDTLAQCTSAGEIRTALQNLPLGLDETYERMLVLIDRNKLQAALVRRALVWLVAALEPQRLPDIMEALKIDLDQRRLDDNIVPTNGTILLDACGSLVTYDSNSDIISLSHFSVKEYLTGELVCTKLPRYHIGWNDAHEELARVCMCYMSLELGHSWKSIYETLSSHPITRYGIPSDERESSSDKEESSDEEESSDPRPLSRTLLSYALSRGFEHLAHLGATHELVWDDMKVLRADIQRRRSKWKKIRYMFSTDRKFWSHSDPLAWSNSKHDFMFYVLVFFAPVLLLETFLDRGAPTPKDGTNPLLYAAHFNKIQHAKILLSRGASVKNVGWVVDGSRQALPVEVAVERRCKDDLVDLFLAEWVPQALLDDTLSRVKELPFRILRSLVRTDAFAEWASMCRHERLLLHEVLEQGCYFKDDKDILSDIARRLVQVGWDASACNSKGQTPLHIAIANHYVAIVEYLASIQVPLPPDILFAAARARRDPGPMMRLLIDNGADVHVLMSDGDSVLHAAMISHYEPECLETVKMLIDAGCDPCTYNSKGETPLHVATIMQHVAIVEYLISIHVPLPPDILLAAARAWNKQGQMMCMLVDNGADVYALTSDGDCVLHLAMGLDDEGECLETVQMLLDAGSDPLVYNSKGETPVHVAAAEGHVAVVGYLLSIHIPLPPDILFAVASARKNQGQMMRMLLDHGADVHALTSDGDSVLHVAIGLEDEGECLETVKMLMDTGCDPCACNSKAETPLHVATTKGHVTVMEYLFSMHIPLPRDILLAAARARRNQGLMIDMLIDKGADVRALTSDGDSVLDVAMGMCDERECLQTAKSLIDAGCEPFTCNFGGTTDLHVVVIEGQVAFMEYLLSAHVQLPPDILLAAARAWKNQAQMMRMLIDNGADVHALTPDGDNALHVAMGFRYEPECLETAKTLIDAGCDPCACNSKGETPLHVATTKGHVTVVEYLVSIHVPLPRDILLAAVRAWNEQGHMMRMLIYKGADVHVLTSDGDSVLHVTMGLDDEGECLETVKMLVHAGCDPSTRNSMGETALQVAISNEHATVVEYLLSVHVALPPHILLQVAAGRTWKNQAWMMRMLIDNGADIHVLASNGDSVLHVAMALQDEHECLHIAKVLVDAGCDPLVCNFDGKTRLFIAVCRGHLSVVQYLLSRDTPLPLNILLAVMESPPRRQDKIMSMLVAKGLDPSPRIPESP